MDRGSHFGEHHNLLISLQLRIDPPYLKCPKPPTDEEMIRARGYYRSGDVARSLGITPKTLRDRIKAGVYPDAKDNKGKRRFSEEEVRRIIRTEETRMKRVKDISSCMA